MLDMYTIRDLTDVKYDDYGDDRADQFWNRFLTILSRLDNPLEGTHLRDCLYHEMKKSTELKIPLREYKKKNLEDRTFADLRQIFTDFLHERREDQRLAREDPNAHQDQRKTRRQAGMKGEGRGKEGKGGSDEGCWRCGGGHFIKDCPEPKPATEIKGRGRGRGKGKGKEGKGKGKGKEGKGKGVPPPPLTYEQRARNALTKCAWFQVKWNQGPGCKWGDECTFKHEECATQAEYDALSKPWSLTPRGAQSPRTSPRGAKGAGKSPRTPSPRGSPVACAATYICPRGSDCPGRPKVSGGNGACQKIHCSDEERNAWKEKQEKAKKKQEAKAAAKSQP